jgi:CheY-like chemotaxis protein
MMGGDLQVQSQLGQGSVFTVTLPAEVSEPAHASVPTANANAPLVLVIDDDAGARDIMERALAKEGYRVAVASSGPQGLELAAELKPAVILLDVIMPGLDGWSVLSSLKKDRAMAPIPVIMMTILSDKNLAFSLGAADHLTKPVQWEQLWGLLRKYNLAVGKPSVLVVDDDPRARELLRRGLAKAGCQVREAGDGRAAQALVAADPPRLILLDLLMPEMDGFEFLRQCRSQPQTRDIPVIVITSKDLTEEDRKRLRGSVSDILQKGGYQLAELLQQVRALVGSEPQTKQ